MVGIYNFFNQSLNHTSFSAVQSSPQQIENNSTNNDAFVGGNQLPPGLGETEFAELINSLNSNFQIRSNATRVLRQHVANCPQANLENFIIRLQSEANRGLVLEHQRRVLDILNLATRRYVSSFGFDARIRLAQDTATPYSVLALLAEEHPETRSSVAFNTNTSPQTLEFLSRDENRVVRMNAVRNSRIPAYALINATQDEDSGVRLWITANRSATAEALNILSRDREELIRRFVAQHLNTLPETLTSLAEDEVPIVRSYVAHNPNISVESLYALAADRVFFVRRSVASNSNTPPEILVHLLHNDEDGRVREAAATTLGLVER